MKMIMYFDTGDKVIGDFYEAPQRLIRETQREYENRVTLALNKSQPHAVHKIVKCKILRN